MNRFRTILDWITTLILAFAVGAVGIALLWAIRLFIWRE